MKSELLMASVLVAASIGACGQITGLGDDYTFDLDAGSQDGASGDGTADVTSDARADGAPAPACSGQTGVSARGTLSSLKGTAECKSCFADQCCTEVVACWPQSSGSDCRNRFECVLRCSEQTRPDERDKCVGNCDDVKSDSASRAMDACQRQSCAAACGGGP